MSDTRDHFIESFLRDFEEASAVEGVPGEGVESTDYVIYGSQTGIREVEAAVDHYRRERLRLVEAFL